MIEKIFVILTILISVKEVLNENLTLSRQKRILPVVPAPPPFLPPLLYAQNAATGILVAIAIPVPLPDQNVFVSYNFEANYNMPSWPNDSFPGPLKRVQMTDLYPATKLGADATPDDTVARKLESNADIDDQEEETTLIPENDDEREKRSIIDNKTILTRVGVYHMIENRLNSDEVNGKKCLLHAICESARVSFLNGSGVLGHVLHILLTPSSSAKEPELPPEYYKAESLGLKGSCAKYEKYCNLNLLSLFSTVLI